MVLLDVLVLGANPKKKASDVFQKNDKVIITTYEKFQHLLHGKCSWEDLPTVTRPKRVATVANEMSDSGGSESGSGGTESGSSGSESEFA